MYIKTRLKIISIVAITIFIIGNLALFWSLNEFQDAQLFLSIILGFFTLIGGSFIFFVEKYLNRLIEQRLAVLSKGAGIIAHGNLDYTIDCEGNDEFCELATSINSMTKNLQAVVRNLEDSEKLFRNYFELGQVGLAIISLDQKWIRANARLCEMLGYTKEELFNTTCGELTHPNDIEAYLAQVDKLLSGEIKRFSVEKRFFHKNGSIVYSRISVACHRGINDNIEYMIAAVEDITEQKKTESIIQESARYSRSLIEAGLDPLFTVNREGRITDVNQSAVEITGVSKENLIDTDFFNYFTDPLRARKGYELVWKQERVSDYRLSIRHISGKITEVLYNGTLYRNKDGGPLGVLVAVRDITEILIKEEIISNAKTERASNLAKSQFLANMSHEIRTPMNAIIGMAELLAETPLTPDQKKYVTIFQKAGDNLLNLVNDILDISKIEFGNFPIVKAEFNLTNAVKDVTEILLHKGREKNIPLTTFIHPNINKLLMGDAQRIKQVLINIIGNAIKFTNEGVISLDIKLNFDEKKKGNILFTITDSGIGISEENQKKLFQSFSQGDSSTTKRFGGTGLGLTISKKLIEMMGGEIEMISKIGVGTTIIFTLNCPVSERSLQGPTKTIQDENLFISSETGQEEKQEKVMKILLVDDSEDNRILIHAYLAKEKYKIVDAENGEIAFDKVKNEKFDLILMDMQMPVMDGYTSTQKIREFEKQNNDTHTTIIALSAYAQKEEEEKSITSGCDLHLNKPILKEKLLRTLQAYLK